MLKKHLLFAALLAALRPAALPAADAPRYAEPIRCGKLQDARLNECSGLAVGRRNPDIFWTHNDTGDTNRLFAITPQGKTRVVLTVSGAKAEDWEDIATGPGADGQPAIYISDTGNNAHQRTDLTVYRIPEPVLQPGEETQQSAPAEAFPFRYPDGNYDAEALMVHPKTGDIYIISKVQDGNAGIYRFPRPLQPGKQVTLERVGTLHFREPLVLARMVTAADIAPDGRRFLVRTYFVLQEFTAPEGQPFEEAFTQQPVRLVAPLELQGEAAAYQADGQGILTASEGRGAPLHLLRRQ